MEISSKEIGVPFVISLIVNLISGYLFSIKIISLNIFLLVLGLSILVIIIIGIQLKTNETEDKLDKIEKELKDFKEKFEERFKIYDRLNNIETKLSIMELNKRNGKK